MISESLIVPYINGGISFQESPKESIFNKMMKADILFRGKFNAELPFLTVENMYVHVSFDFCVMVLNLIITDLFNFFVTVSTKRCKNRSSEDSEDASSPSETDSAEFDLLPQIKRTRQLRNARRSKDDKKLDTDVFESFLE